MNIQPLGDRVLVAPEEETEKKTQSGIYIPDTAKEKPQLGRVESVGEGRMKDDGSRIPVSIQKNDRVFYSKYGGTEIKMGDKTYLIMSESEILAVVR